MLLCLFLLTIFLFLYILLYFIFELLIFNPSVFINHYVVDKLLVKVLSLIREPDDFYTTTFK